MGNCVGKMQGPVPPVPSGEVTEPQRPSTVPSAPLSPSSRNRSRSAPTNFAAIPPRPSTTAAVVVPPIDLWNDLEFGVWANVAISLNNPNDVKALRPDK
jgi:hypothetical protein